MKKTLTRRLSLLLMLAMVFSAALSGCGQSPAGTPSAPPESTAPEAPSGPADSGGETPEVPESTPAPAPDAGGDPAGAENDAAGPSTPTTTAPAAGSGTPSTPDTAKPSTTTPPTTPTPEPPPPPAPAPAPEPTPEPAPPPAPGDSSGSTALSGTTLNVQFGDDGPSFTLDLYDNDTASAIARHVGTAAWRLPIYHYDDYTNWEIMQYYDIPSRYDIPSNPESVSSVKAGEVYYSAPNRIILFYGDGEVSGEYTPVGCITYSQEFVDAVEDNPVLEGWGNKIVHISE